MNRFYEAKHMLSYLEAGGEVKLCTYNATNVIEMLEKGSLIIAVAASGLIWNHLYDADKKQVDDIYGESFYHIVLAKSHKDGKIELLDPHPNAIEGRQFHYWVEKDIFVNATLVTGATLVEILK